MMRQSLQAVLPEISGNKTSLLRKSVCSDLLTLFNSPHSALPSLLVSGMPEWQVHNPSDKHLQSWYCRQLRSALLFHEPRIAALQVNLKEAYCHTLAISLEIMLYHDDEPLTFDLVWIMAVRPVRRWRMSAKHNLQLAQFTPEAFGNRIHAGIHSARIGRIGSPVRPDSVQPAARCEFLVGWRIPAARQSHSRRGQPALKARSSKRQKRC